MADWEANVRRVVPYTPGEQPKRTDIIKLNTNECPYPPAPGVAKALQEFEADKLRLYPDPAALELREAIAAAVSVPEHPVAADQVFVGVGSDDVLALAFLTFFNSKKPILFPDITYSFYDVWADLYGIPYRTPELDEKFRLKKGLPDRKRRHYFPEPQCTDRSDGESGYDRGDRGKKSRFRCDCRRGLCGFRGCECPASCG